MACVPIGTSAAHAVFQTFRLYSVATIFFKCVIDIIYFKRSLSTERRIKYGTTIVHSLALFMTISNPVNGGWELVGGPDPRKESLENQAQEAEKTDPEEAKKVKKQARSNAVPFVGWLEVSIKDSDGHMKQVKVNILIHAV